MSSTLRHHQISEVLTCREGAPGPPAMRGCRDQRPGQRRPRLPCWRPGLRPPPAPAAREPLATAAPGAGWDTSWQASHAETGRAPAPARVGAGGAARAAGGVCTCSAREIRAPARIWLRSVVRAARGTWFINSEGRRVSESDFLQKIFKIDVLGVSKRLKRTWP